MTTLNKQLRNKFIPHHSRCTCCTVRPRAPSTLCNLQAPSGIYSRPRLIPHRGFSVCVQSDSHSGGQRSQLLSNENSRKRLRCQILSQFICLEQKDFVHCYRLVGLPNVKHHQCLTSCTLSLLKIIIKGYVYILHIQYLTNEKDINVPQYMQQLVKFKVRNLIVIGLINA